LFKSRNAKIALAVFLVIVLGLIAYYYYTGLNSEVTEEDKTAVSDDETRGGGQLPQEGQSPSAGGGAVTSPTSTTLLPGQSPAPTDLSPTPVGAATMTPNPEAGIFDYTRQPEMTPIDVEINLTTEQIEQIQNQDICAMSGISDSWSDPFEKILCNMTEFMTNKVLLSLQQLSCEVLVSALKLNYKSTITVDNTGGRCLIIDR